MSESQYTKPDLAMVGESHIQRYRETNGEEGYLWNGVPTLLLTTVGRRSGQDRTSALIFGRDGRDLLIIASQGGAPVHPNWYHNLSANPKVRVQVKSEQYTATARTASEDEKGRLWTIMTSSWPNYDLYQSRTDRPIPLVVLTPDD